MVAAVPVRVVAERRVVRHFIHAGAVRPTLAVGYETGNFMRKRAFARLQDAGVLKAAQGGWYLDEDAWRERRGARRKRAAIAVGIVAAVGAILAAL
jgi:hypothetical protein